jgi:galactokinase
VLNEIRFRVCSPGRVNLIGEHTDYNGGLVLPFAIDKQIHLQVNVVHGEFSILFESKQQNKSFLCTKDIFESDELTKRLIETTPFASYCLGSVKLFNQESRGAFLKAIEGFNIQISLDSNLPLGAGLSSSASLCCGTLYACSSIFEKLTHTKTDPFKIALLAQKVEHEFAGTKCGLMDQLAVLYGSKNAFVSIDFLKSTENKPAQIETILAHKNLNDFELLVFNTNVSHQLAESEYNTRRKQCEFACQELNEMYGKNHKFLSNFSVEQILESRRKFSQENFFKRAFHVVAENERVKKATSALKCGNVNLLSQLMQESHESLKNDFEVSCFELNAACESLIEFVPAEMRFGPRMTGGGFGGSVVCGIHKSVCEKVLLHFSTDENLYTTRTNLKPTLFTCKVSQGVHLL